LSSLIDADRRPRVDGVCYLAEPPPYGEPAQLLPGLWWLRLPLPLRLDHVNVWLARDPEGWTIVDTGFDTPETRQIWEAVLRSLLADAPVHRLLATHYHPDHIGLAGWLAARTGAELWTTRSEWLLARLLSLDTSEEFDRVHELYDRLSGLPEPLIRERRAAGNLYRKRASPPPGRYRRLRAGNDIALAGRRFRVVIGEGHAPEMITLVSMERDLVIAADQLLPRISPVVAVPASAPESDPLSDFLASLERYREIPADAMVLPSHGRPYCNLPVRLQQLAEHHEERLERALQACVAPATIFEILPALFESEIGPSQLGFALGETWAHMNHLLARGAVERWLAEDGAYRFRAVAVPQARPERQALASSRHQG
jgi:glyoxylase-like metal-dependent hydrolase (beta-lactamase superfamily II)